MSANIMAFDFGNRRIGVAVGHPSIGRGQGIGIVQAKDGQPDFVALEKLVSEWCPEGFVLGVPGLNSESATGLKKKIFQFGETLTQRFNIPVSYVDETLSTEESIFRMHQPGERVPKAKKTDERNKISAGIILETYFSQLLNEEQILETAIDRNDRLE